MSYDMIERTQAVGAEWRASQAPAPVDAGTQRALWVVTLIFMALLVPVLLVLLLTGCMDQGFVPRPGREELFDKFVQQCTTHPHALIRDCEYQAAQVGLADWVSR